MTKKYSIVLTLLFCLFVGGMSVGGFLMPDKEFSEMENRYLEKVPTLSWSGLKDGSFMKKAEDYAADHVPGRDFWVELKAWSEKLSGKKENNGVYIGAQETLLDRVEQPDENKLAGDMQALNKLVSNVTVPVYFGLIPSNAAVWSDRLPAGAPTADELAAIEALYGKSDAINVDMAAALLAHKGEEIFYRTDHHWTSLGAYYGANALLQAMGMEPLDLRDYEKTTVSEDFNGTIFSTSGVHWFAPDRIDTYIPEEGKTVTAYRSDVPEAGQLYDESYLEKKDKYSFFLGGNKPLCVIENEKAADDSKVLVIRDSYSDSMAPFLTERFSQVHLYDLRYNWNSVKTYVEENGIDQVVVLYSFPNFAEDVNLKLMGR